MTLGLVPAIRQMRLYLPALAPPETLMFRRMTAHEGLSRLFEYDVELVSDSHLLDLDKVLGQEMAIGLDMPLHRERFFHGYVASFGQVEAEGEKAVYRAVVRPHLWRLGRTSDCRVFQKQRVPEIVGAILGVHGIPFETQLGGGHRGSYLPWDYCVQYRETDLSFISRLLEQEGIHYYFKHEKGKHLLVLTDAMSGHAEVPGYETVEYRRTSGGRQGERLWDWRVSRNVLPGTYAVSDYDFLAPTADLLRVSGSEVERKHKKGVDPDYEIFDYPEEVVQQTGYDPHLLEELARVRIGEVHAQYETITVQTDARGVHPGALFKVSQHPRPDQTSVQYLVVKADFQLFMDDLRSGTGGGDQPVYEATLQLINSKHGYRPPRSTPKPVVQGMQSATVVGPAGEKVWTDEHGRVKVLFHWDRANKVDQSKAHEKSSCWVRVSQPWAGANWGAMFLPHVGQEVLVSFLEGDPDRPVITGRVHNAANMPPLTLPDNKLKSIIRDNFGNEIVMDGTPGDEHLSFHSPHHYSIMQLGKSSKLFTRSTQATYSYDSESYHFGTKKSYTKGRTVAIDAGDWFSFKRGAGVAATLGADASVFAGFKLSAMAGAEVKLSLSWTASFGRAREFKHTRGEFKQRSDQDLMMDSGQRLILVGGKDDNTLIVLNNDEMSLSFDKGTPGRDLTNIDKNSAKLAATSAGLFGLAAGLSVYSYHHDVTRSAELDGTDRDGKPDGKTKQMWAELDEVEGVTNSDIAQIIGIPAMAFSAAATLKPTLESPVHKKSSAKITLRENVIEMFVGENKKSAFTMKMADGFEFSTNENFAVSADNELAVSGKTVSIVGESKVTVVGGDIVLNRNLLVRK